MLLIVCSSFVEDHLPFSPIMKDRERVSTEALSRYFGERVRYLRLEDGLSDEMLTPPFVQGMPPSRLFAEAIS
jgi:hypothetical protein